MSVKRSEAEVAGHDEELASVLYDGKPDAGTATPTSDGPVEERPRPLRDPNQFQDKTVPPNMLKAMLKVDLRKVDGGEAIGRDGAVGEPIGEDAVLDDAGARAPREPAGQDTVVDIPAQNTAVRQPAGQDTVVDVPAQNTAVRQPAGQDTVVDVPTATGGGSEVPQLDCAEYDVRDGSLSEVRPSTQNQETAWQDDAAAKRPRVALWIGLVTALVVTVAIAALLRSRSEPAAPTAQPQATETVDTAPAPATVPVPKPKVVPAVTTASAPVAPSPAETAPTARAVPPQTKPRVAPAVAPRTAPIAKPSPSPKTPKPAGSGAGPRYEEPQF